MNFLRNLLGEDKSSYTVEVYMASISTKHVEVEGSTFGSYSLICSFLKGTQSLKPCRAPRSPQWDLHQVLDPLRHAPFEPPAEADLKASFLLFGRPWEEFHYLRLKQQRHSPAVLPLLDFIALIWPRRDSYQLCSSNNGACPSWLCWSFTGYANTASQEALNRNTVTFVPSVLWAIGSEAIKRQRKWLI